MPPRLEQELDHVTLHNSALMNMDQDPTTGFEKLNFLLSQTPCPPQVLSNLLLLYVKYEYYELCADLLAENQQLVKKTFSNYLQEYLEATALLSQTAPDEAYKKFEDLSVRHINQLRRTTTSIQEARSNHNEDAVKIHLEEYDQAVESYIPILMAQAKIYWDKENYEMVEKIFRKSVEFCNEVDVWKLNVAHVLFMQESKYKEAISFYEPIVKKSFDNVFFINHRYCKSLQLSWQIFVFLI